MDIKLIAAILLSFRLVSVLFLALVLRKQRQIMQQRSIPELTTFRRALFCLVLVLMIGQIVPVVIDSATILFHVTRGNPTRLGVSYAFSNAFTDMLKSVIIWLVYRLAEHIKIDGVDA